MRGIYCFLIGVSVVRTVGAQLPEAADSLARELRQVVVTARQPATRLVGSTLVSRIAGSPLAGLGTAYDVLARLPMMEVTDDEVTVTGKGTPEIYIDGRLMHDKDELRTLLSGQIRKVELLMAPGARYGSTVRAVLKITTKRAFAEGLSASSQTNVTARRKWSADEHLDVSWMHKHLDVFGSGFVARSNARVKGSTVNRLVYEGRPLTIGSRQRTTRPARNGGGKAGFNYAKDAFSLGGYYRYTAEHEDFRNAGTEWMDSEPEIRLNIAKRVTGRKHLAAVYCDREWAGHRHFRFDGNFIRSLSGSRANTSYPDNERRAVVSEEDRDSRLWAGKLCLEVPLWGGTLALGTEDAYTQTALDYRMLNPEVGAYLPSQRTASRQVSLAAFADWQRRIGRLSLSAGLRYEYADRLFRVNGRREDAASRTDHLLTPDIRLDYTFGPRSSVAFTYRMHTERPPYSRLMSGLTYVGMHQIEGGNPGLRDERVHEAQLTGQWKDLMGQVGMLRSRDAYAFVKRLYPAPDVQLLMSPLNADVTLLSLYGSWSRTVRCWTPRLTAGASFQRMELEGMPYDRPQFSYRLMNTFSLPHGFQAVADAYGCSSGHLHTNLFAASWFVTNVKVVRSFFGQTLSVGLSATDVFNTACNDWSMHTCGIRMEKRQSNDRRGVSLQVIYRFRPRRNSYKGEMAADREMNRL